MWNKHRISSINAPPPPINRMLNGIPPPNMINFNSTNRQFSPAYNGFWFLFHIINFVIILLYNSKIIYLFSFFFRMIIKLYNFVVASGVYFNF